MTGVATHCPYCALQCGMSVGNVGEISPRQFPTNRGGLCRKGWTAGELLDHPERLTTPLVSGRPAAWDEALDVVAAGIRRAQAAGGPDAAAVFGGGGLTNEKTYQLGKFARVALGTSQIDYNGRFCMASATAARAVAGGGLHLQPEPGTDLAVALGLLHVVVAEGWCDEAYIAARTTGFDEVRRAAAPWWPERVERLSGVGADQLRRAAALLGGAHRRGGGVYVLTGRGVEQHATGTATVSAFIDLALALGLSETPGSGYGCVTGQGNGQGGREHGQKADQLPGYRRIDDPAAREHVDTRARRVTLADDSVLRYDDLVLATGSRAAIPPVEGLAEPDGSPAPGVVPFRTVEDCERITELAGRGPMAVIGGGLLGVEAARGLAGLGVDVTVVHPVGHLMERQLDAGRGSVLAGVLDGLGVRLRLGVAAASWRPGHEGLGVLTLTDGSTLDVAGVVVSAGVAPQTWLARRAGVTVGRSILVAQLPARAVICRCNGVTKGDLVTAWSTGARERAALATATRATTGCGSCADAGEGLCTWLNDADPESAVPAGQEGAA